ncbi:MAG: class I SAM-dependent methyltransferase [Candidatus Acidiferrales bacterium]
MQSTHVENINGERSSATPQLFGGAQRAEKMQGHWVLARAGKRVLRPGGLELTRQMIEALAIGPLDRVVEFAPGLGVTAQMVLRREPCAYCGVEREPAAAEHLRKQLDSSRAKIVLAPAEQSGLPDCAATVVYGEAMLSMQTQEQKSRIIAEACRLLVPGGRYGIHEMCLLPDDISDALRREIQAAMSKEIHVGVQPLTRGEWTNLFEQHGLKVTWSNETSMHLLEPRRLLQDEGFAGAFRFAFNLATSPTLRRRVLAMRRLFRRYEKHLGAISLVGQRVGNA